MITPYRAIDVKALFYNEFGACGCSDIEDMIRVIKMLLEWASSSSAPRKYDTLFNDDGVFYLLAGRLDSMGFIEHGVSIRFSWITDKGTSLLNALNKFTPEQIDESEGVIPDTLPLSK